MIFHTELRLQKVEEVTKSFAEIQKHMDDTVDGIHRMLMWWNSSSELGSNPRSSRPIDSSPPPPSTETYPSLTPNEMTFLKKHEATGKNTLL
jgi:hypothetical protein